MWLGEAVDYRLISKPTSVFWGWEPQFCQSLPMTLDKLHTLSFLDDKNITFLVGMLWQLNEQSVPSDIIYASHLVHIFVFEWQSWGSHRTLYIKKTIVLHSSLYKVSSWRCFQQKIKNKDEIRPKRQQHLWQRQFSGERANPERMVASQRALFPQLR